MNSERIKEIQKETAYPNSVSVHQALLKVWNECEQTNLQPQEDEKESDCTCLSPTADADNECCMVCGHLLYP